MIKLAEEKMVTCIVSPMIGEEGEPVKIRMFINQNAINKIEDIEKNGVGQDNDIYIDCISADMGVFRKLKDNWRYNLEFAIIESKHLDKNKEDVLERKVELNNVEFYNLKNSIDNGESNNVSIRAFSHSKCKIH